MKQNTNQNGITLVALVITVILTLIIAGVAISLITGQNGLFARANQAASEYTTNSQLEADRVTGLQGYLDQYYTEENGGGTPTQIADFQFTANAKGTSITVSTTGVTGLTYKYQIDSGAWISPSSGTSSTYTFEGLTPSTQYTVNMKAITGTIEKEASNTDKTVTTTAVTTLADVNTVAEAIAYNAAAANTIQTLKTTDNKQVKIPAGFTVLTGDRASATSSTGGVVIKDSAENEFVWIPVDNASTGYVRSAFNTSSITQFKNGIDLQTSSDKIYRSDDDSYYCYEELDSYEYNSVSTNKGYYIGRYETTGSGDNVTVKYNEYPYVNISQADCVTKSTILGNGYKTAYPTANATVFTKLCSSYAWDTALTFIGGTYASNSPQGNYNDTSFSGGTDDAHKIIINTGLTTPVSNIYDMGGNVLEFTTESSTNTGNTYIRRGGMYSYSASVYPAGFRHYNAGRAINGCGFRITMYL